jgi:hypothetical protein
MGKDNGRFLSEFNTLQKEEKLRRLLTKAETPITDRRIATMLTFANGANAYGYNTETDTGIMHAEIRALTGVPTGNPLKSVDLMIGTEGSWTDIKYALPCEPCTTALTPFANNDTAVNLHNANYPVQVGLSFGELKKAYEPFLEVPGPAQENIDAFLQEHTPLTEVDRKIVSHIGNAVRNADGGSALYLTGTASGRGGPKSILASKLLGSTYMDIDLILITQTTEHDVVDNGIKKLYGNVLNEVGFPHAALSVVDVPSYKLDLHEQEDGGLLFRRVYSTDGMFEDDTPFGIQKDPTIPSSIDVSVGLALESIITQNYLKNKRYIQIV